MTAFAGDRAQIFPEISREKSIETQTKNIARKRCRAPARLLLRRSSDVCIFPLSSNLVTCWFSLCLLVHKCKRQGIQHPLIPPPPPTPLISSVSLTGWTRRPWTRGRGACRTATCRFRGPRTPGASRTQGGRTCGWPGHSPDDQEGERDRQGNKRRINYQFAPLAWLWS